MVVRRRVPHDDAVLREHYGLIIERFPDCVVVEDQHGTYRFRRNEALQFLFENDRLDLNRLAVDFHHGWFPLDDYARLYMELGVSLSMWLEVFSEHYAEKRVAPCSPS